MFMKSTDNEVCSLYCSCGCETGVILRADKDDLFGTSLSLVTDTFYVMQQNGWDRFKEKCKRIWCIIKNKEYYYCEMILDDEDVKEFKEFVSQM